MTTQLELPEKLFFKIGEVASISNVKQHVLRYWESEFSSIRPQKSKSNQRLYRRRDVEAILAIKHLLYDRKFTIEGAKKHLKSEGIDNSLPPPDPKQIAARARDEALLEAEDKIAADRAQTKRTFEKQLLSLRQDVTNFVGDLPPQDPDPDPS
jgi:DNA-binding transcriptional MerR regulator